MYVVELIKSYLELSPIFIWTKIEMIMLDISEMALIIVICVADGYIWRLVKHHG